LNLTLLVKPFSTGVWGTLVRETRVPHHFGGTLIIPHICAETPFFPRETSAAGEWGDSPPKTVFTTSPNVLSTAKCGGAFLLKHLLAVGGRNHTLRQTRRHPQTCEKEGTNDGRIPLDPKRGEIRPRGPPTLVVRPLQKPPPG